jgi:hypothetical protein
MMTGLRIYFSVLEPILLLALLALAIAAYRSHRSTAFLLLMLSSICYFIPRFAPYVIWATAGGSTEASARIHAWFASWSFFGMNRVFDALFVVLLCVSFIVFIRGRRVMSHEAPNQALQPTAGRSDE